MTCALPIPMPCEEKSQRCAAETCSLRGQSSSEDRCEAVCWRRAGKANVSDMAALLDHAQQWVSVCLQESIRFQKSRSRCTSSADLESTGDRATAAPDGLSQTWGDKLRAGRQSLCGGEAASSTPRGGGVATRNSVTPPGEEGEASSDALCEGGVSGDSSSSEAQVGDRLRRSDQQHGEEQVALRIARTIRKERREHPQLQGNAIRKERKEHTLTARHKCAPQGRGSDDSHRSRDAGE